MHLFGSGQSGIVVGAPTWQELPPETQRALIKLMVRLLVEHADKRQTAPMTGAGHDL
jgi:TRAP-type C4-dicarboxylate transport system substrate-binding protein